jgi:uncharacterized membrane protein
VSFVPLSVRSGSHQKSLTGWFVAVCGLYAAVSALFIHFGIWRYTIFRSGVDEGIFTQVIETAFHGFGSTVEGGANHLLVHASPILVVAIPFVQLFHGAIGLIVLQSLLMAAVVFPLWGVAASRFPLPVAFGVTVLAAAFPPLTGEAVDDFHELAFGPVLEATLVWAIDRRCWRAGIVAVLALACVKEDAFVAMAFVGIVLALTSREDAPRRTFGFAVLAIGVLAAAAYFGVVRPLINPHFPYWSLHFYEWNLHAATPAGFVGPTSPLRPLYLLQALAPLAFIPLLSRYAVFAIPGLVEVLASHEAITLAMGAHYSATWSGYLLAAFVDGAGCLWKRRVVLTSGALAVATGLTVWISYAHHPMEPRYYLYRLPNADDHKLEAILRTLPPNASVGAEDEVFAHLGTDPNASIGVQGQTWFIYDRSHYSDRWRLIDAPALTQMVTRGVYRVRSDDGTIVVLQRAGGVARAPG